MQMISQIIKLNSTLPKIWFDRPLDQVICNDDTYVSWMIITVPISDPVFIKATNSEVKKNLYIEAEYCAIYYKK